MRGLARINQNITKGELLDNFQKHISEGWSATSFHGRMGVGQEMVKQWQSRFPSFALEFAKAKEKDRLISFHGNKLGPTGLIKTKGGSMEQKPTVGRIVHVADEKGNTCAAVVTCVHSETIINVTRFNQDGTTEAELSLGKVSDAPKGVKDWNWPARV